jgi:hypothetical protein
MYEVKSSVVYSTHVFMNRILFRPSGQDQDVYNFIMGGPDVDCNKISTSREELIKAFYSITKRTDIYFGDLVWISKYRSERGFYSLLELTVVDHIRPNIRMVNTLRVGRVFIAGGQLPNWSHL